MPRLTVIMVRAALVYFVPGFAAGAIVLAGRGLELDPSPSRLRPLHYEHFWWDG